MVTKNDITGDSIQSKAMSEAYRNNYDRIFAKSIICYWPDAFWCHKHEIESFLAHRSDDFSVLYLNKDYSYEEIDEIVNNYVQLAQLDLPSMVNNT